jgi:hypothetical protein
MALHTVEKKRSLLYQTFTAACTRQAASQFSDNPALRGQLVRRNRHLVLEMQENK